MKKLFTLVVCLSVFGTIFNVGSTIAKANNYKDTSLTYFYNNDGCERSTGARLKQDGSATYVSINNNSLPMFFWVAGTNNKKNTTTIDFNRCSGICNMTPGQHVKKSNWVHGNYSYAYLVEGTAYYGNGWVYGVWSPDNKAGTK